MAKSTTSGTTEVASVLFIDIVAFSQQVIEDQRQSVRNLHLAVEQSSNLKQARKAGLVTALLPGDAVILVFLPPDPMLAAKSALEIRSILNTSAHPRMGINMGPVSVLEDLNGAKNFVGDGINIAQRVMDCADPGQILVSYEAANALQASREWRPYLHDLGVHAIKHDVKVGLCSLVKDGLGSVELPSKLRRSIVPEGKGEPHAKKPEAGLIWTVFGFAATAGPAVFQITGYDAPSWLARALSAVGGLAAIYGVWLLLQHLPARWRYVATGALAVGLIWLSTYLYGHVGREQGKQDGRAFPPPQPSGDKPSGNPDTPAANTEKEAVKSAPPSLSELKIMFYNGATDPEFFVNRTLVQPASYSSGLARFRLPPGSYRITADYPTQECVALVSVPDQETIGATCTPK